MSVSTILLIAGAAAAVLVMVVMQRATHGRRGAVPAAETVRPADDWNEPGAAGPQVVEGGAQQDHGADHARHGCC